MLCRKYSAKQALEWGLANAVVPMEKLDEEVQKWCDEILALSPTCLRILKGSFVDEYENILGQGDIVRRLVLTPEFWRGEQQEGARAFLEKRKPDFRQFRKAKA